MRPCSWGWGHGNGGGDYRPLFDPVGLLLMADVRGGSAWRRWRVLLLWGSVLFVLAGYLWLVDIPRERTGGEPVGPADKLLDFDPTNATALGFKTADAEIALMKDQVGTWQILSPLKTAADQTVVRSFLSHLNDARRLRLIDETPTALGSYGLEPAQLTLRITVGSVDHQIDFGENSPVGSSTYVRVRPVTETGRQTTGGPAAPVVLVPLEVKQAADKKVFDLRKKELFDFAAADVTQVELRNADQPGSVVRLERRPIATKGQGHPADWMMAAPISTMADQEVVEGLVKQISALRATAILDAGKVEKLAAFKRPKTEVAMRVGERSAAVRFYLPLGEEAAYAVTTPEAPLYQVDRQAVLQLDKDVFELRDKRVVQMDRATVQGLEIQQPHGSYQLTKRGDEWLYHDRPLPKSGAEKLRKFLDELWRVKVEKIAGHTTEAWSKLGLREGATVITAFSSDDHGTQPVVVRLGKVEGELLYIRRGDENESYIIKSSLTKLLPLEQDFTN